MSLDKAKYKWESTEYTLILADTLKKHHDKLSEKQKDIIQWFLDDIHAEFWTPELYYGLLVVLYDIHRNAFIAIGDLFKEVEKEIKEEYKQYGDRLNII